MQEIDDIPAKRRRKSRCLPKRRARKSRTSSRKRSSCPKHPSREAVMTLVSILQDDGDPRLQIAAAKALLSSKTAKDLQPEILPELSEDDIDTAIAAAKKLLDELAARKAGHVHEPGGMAVAGAAAADYPAG